MRPGRRPKTRTRSERKTASSIWCVMNRTVDARGRPNAQQFRLHDLARLRVERGERFVHQQDVRVHGQRARQVNALTHAARKLPRVVLLEALEPDELEQVAQMVAFGGRQTALDLEADRRVAPHRTPRLQRVGLKDERPVRARLRHAAAVDRNRSRIEGFEAVDDAQERRLPASARTDDADELAVANVDVDVRTRPRDRRRISSNREPRASAGSAAAASITTLSTARERARDTGTRRSTRCPRRPSTITLAKSCGMLKTWLALLMR